MEYIRETIRAKGGGALGLYILELSSITAGGGTGSTASWLGENGPKIGSLSGGLEMNRRSLEGTAVDEWQVKLFSTQAARRVDSDRAMRSWRIEGSGWMG